MATEDPILDGLNDHQLEAVTLDRGSALILAGAGSGKTNVLTRRIAWLISRGVDPNEILAVTFTNKAAGEMRKRIKRLLPDVDTKNMWVGTFHGTCFRMISANPEAAGMKPGVTIIDEEDRKVVIRRVMKEVGVPVSGSKEDKERGGGVSVNTVATKLAGWKERGLGPESRRDESTQDLDRIFASYEAMLQRDNLLDFADLMNRCLQALENDPEILNNYRDKFSHILVDEFQDTNDQQFHWLNLLRNDSCQVMAVGDDDQSIYGFRNARPENMNDFLEQMEGCRLIKLERNYRSSQQILDLANAVIDNNEGRLGKELWSDRLDGSLPVLSKFESDLNESDAIVEDIAKRIANGQQPSSIAVVYRTNAQSRLFEKRMVVRNIPHKVFGGQRFYERQEIKNMLAWMQFSQNLDNETSMMRIVNFPARGLGDKSLEDLRARAAGQDRSLFSQMLAEVDRNTKVRDFVDIVFRLEEVRLGGTLVDFVHAVTEMTGLGELYGNLSDPQEAQERVANMMDMANAALEFQNEKGVTSCDALLEEFLATSCLESSTTAEADAVKSSRNAVSLMTVHTAKGLEFQTVYLTGLEHGLFPHSAAIGNDPEPDQEGLEEERRLLYVAVTRAMHDLHVSYSMKRFINGQQEKTGASTFIKNDMPAHLMQFQNFAPGMKSETPPPPERRPFRPQQARPRRSFS